MATIDFDFNLAPQDAINYLDKKGYVISYDYDDIEPELHNKSFTVAKVTRLDLLQDIHQSLVEAQKSGIRFDDWRKQIKPTLQKKGWYGKREIINPKTGEVKDVYIGARRLKHMFRTNMRVAHNTQRYKKMMTLTKAVFWRYISALKPTTRDKHAALHGVTFHRDHDFWKTHYPQNDHGCLCKVRAYTGKELDKRNIKLTKKTPEPIAHPDWSHNVGSSSRVGGLTKLNLGSNLAAMKPNKDLDNLDEDQLKDRFYKTLNVKENELYIDKVNDPMLINDALFTSASGHSKLTKRQRHLYLDQLAQSISDPDEIYLQAETLKSGQSRIVKKMLKYVKTEKDHEAAFMAIFEYQQDKTQGVSIYVAEGKNTVDKKRGDKLVYQKETD